MARRAGEHKRGKALPVLRVPLISLFTSLLPNPPVAYPPSHCLFFTYLFIKRGEKSPMESQLSRGLHQWYRVGLFFCYGDMNSNESVTLGEERTGRVKSTASPSLAQHCPLIYSAKVISWLRRGRQHILAPRPRAAFALQTGAVLLENHRPLWTERRLLFSGSCSV